MKRRTDRPRLSPLFEYDLDLCGGVGEVAGADEAGRGCFAGPLVSAAVVFDYSRVDTDFCIELLEGLRDSKQLTKLARTRLYPLILQCASRFSIAVSSPNSIDNQGLHRRNLSDLAACLRLVAEDCTGPVLVDGYKLGDQAVPHRSVPGGDSLSAAIAAASIIAKATRDRLMQRFHILYPEYGFASNVGYGTREHRQSIAEHGYTPLHRMSFNQESIQALKTASRKSRPGTTSRKSRGAKHKSRPAGKV